jgi:hypothetical protein
VGGVTDFLLVAAREAARSPFFCAQINRLRRLAAGNDRNGYSGDTGRLTVYTLEQLEALAAAGKRRHVCDYLAGLRNAARMGLGSALLAERIHELVKRGEGYGVDLVGVMTRSAWPTGPAASTCAAVITGASWNGATANRQLWRRYRPNGAVFIL